VSIENIDEFKENGAKCFGIGSNMFDQDDVKNSNLEGLEQSLNTFRNKIRDER